MPKAARYAVAWVPEHRTYLFQTQGEDATPQSLRDDESWFSWLVEHTAFSFQGEHGTINLLKESRERGESGYWYAYRRQGKRMAKRYAGRSRELTFSRLEAIAGALSGKFGELSPADEQLNGNGAPQHHVMLANLLPATSAAEFDEPLLATKFQIPRLSVQHIARDHLIAQLDQGALP